MQAEDRRHVEAARVWLLGLFEALLPVRLGADQLVEVRHTVIELMPGEPEHKFVVIIPEETGGLLIGTRGRTADCFRRLLRIFAQGRDWPADVDLRVVKRRP